jgi:hypothetical protein
VGKPLKRHFPKHVRTVRAYKLYLTPGAGSGDRAIGSSAAAEHIEFSAHEHFAPGRNGFTPDD